MGHAFHIILAHQTWDGTRPSHSVPFHLTYQTHPESPQVSENQILLPGSGCEGPLTGLFLVHCHCFVGHSVLAVDVDDDGFVILMINGGDVLGQSGVVVRFWTLGWGHFGSTEVTN
ncbi:hypothetical protein ACFX15_004156 [Malus domestica]